MNKKYLIIIVLIFLIGIGLVISLYLTNKRTNNAFKSNNISPKTSQLPKEVTVQLDKDGFQPSLARFLLIAVKKELCKKTVSISLFTRK